MKLAGIDLAWRPEKNGTAIAIGTLAENVLTLDLVHEHLLGLETILGALDSSAGIAGIAVDASLIINNVRGQRQAERELSKDYAGRRAGCHATNLTLYPMPASVELARCLDQGGYKFSGQAGCEPFLIECYPHPAMIEMFSLPMRLAYKKGRVEDRRRGQAELAGLIRRLEMSPILQLIIPDSLSEFFAPDHILQLRGAAIKRNEDVLDAVICLYICGLYAREVPHTVYGTKHDGFIYVPQVVCI